MIFQMHVIHVRFDTIELHSKVIWKLSSNEVNWKYEIKIDINRKWRFTRKIVAKNAMFMYVDFITKGKSYKAETTICVWFCGMWPCRFRNITAFEDIFPSFSAHLVFYALTGMYCSIRPPGKMPCNLGPNLRSLSNVNTTVSVNTVSKACSPWVRP